MKFVFEKDIPAFRGKSWAQRIALRREAAQRDHRISVRALLVMVLPLPGLLLLIALRHYEVLHSWAVVGIIYFVFYKPISSLCRPLWVNPLIKDALSQA